MFMEAVKWQSKLIFLNIAKKNQNNLMSPQENSVYWSYLQINIHFSQTDYLFSGLSLASQ